MVTVYNVVTSRSVMSNRSYNMSCGISVQRTLVRIGMLEMELDAYVIGVIVEVQVYTTTKHCTRKVNNKLPPTRAARLIDEINQLLS